MDRIRALIHRQLPWLSLRSRVLIDALLLSAGALGTASELSTRLGLQSRFGLARLLREDGLPPLHRLAGFVVVLYWSSQWEWKGVTFARSALASGKDPAAAYRLVKRITGRSWHQVRDAGLDWVLARFLAECRNPNYGRPKVEYLAPLGRVHRSGNSTVPPRQIL